jgi:hypothetical protein
MELVGAEVMTWGEQLEKGSKCERKQAEQKKTGQGNQE